MNIFFSLTSSDGFRGFPQRLGIVAGEHIIFITVRHSSPFTSYPNVFRSTFYNLYS